jgi:hypothetical protein
MHQTTRHLMTAVIAPLLLFTLPVAAATFTENVTINPNTGVVTGQPGQPILLFPTVNLPTAVTLNTGDELILSVTFSGGEAIQVTKDATIPNQNGIQVVVSPLLGMGPFQTSTLTLTGVLGSTNTNSASETTLCNCLVGDITNSTGVDLTDSVFTFTGFKLDTTLLPSPDGASTFNASNFYFSVDYADTTVVSQTPLPVALPLFATGLGGLGLLGWRRKRKAQAGV